MKAAVNKLQIAKGKTISKDGIINDVNGAMKKALSEYKTAVKNLKAHNAKTTKKASAAKGVKTVQVASSSAQKTTEVGHVTRGFVQKSSQDAVVKAVEMSMKLIEARNELLK